MTLVLSRWLHLACALAAGTGLVYGWMLYLAEPADEFSLVNHPAQPSVQAAHILLSPLLLFLCGVIWRSHIWSKIRRRSKERRITGWAMALLLVPMVVSGYLIQVSDLQRELWVWVHGVSSVTWVVAYLVHAATKPGTASAA